MATGARAPTVAKEAEAWMEIAAKGIVDLTIAKVTVTRNDGEGCWRWNGVEPGPSKE